MALNDREKAIFLVGWHLSKGGSFNNGARDVALATAITASTYVGVTVSNLVGEVYSSFRDLSNSPFDASGAAGSPVEVWN